MNKFIAKILIAAMVLTTVITPVEFGFAETEASGENSQQQIETEIDTEQKTQQMENGQAEAAEETVEEEMQFLYLDQQQIEAPGTQNIAVSWEDEIDLVTEMLLIYENSSGQQFELKENERTEKSILFTKEFDESETGTYVIKGIKYFIDDTENYLLLDDLEIAAGFEVVDEVTTEEVKEADELTEKVEDNLAVVETNGEDVDDRAVQAQVISVLEEAKVLKASSTSSKKNIVIVLDPGHGGNDPGATRKLGENKYLYERDINLKIANACRDEFKKYSGVTVYMTRTTNSHNPSIAERVSYAAKKNADLLVSLHINAAVSSSAKGAEVWAPNENYKKTIYKEGQEIAQSIQDELVELGLVDRGVKESYSKDNTLYPDKSLADYYGIIRESKKKGFVGIIVEHAFISNASDRKLLTSDTKIKQLGAADALGIANYYGLSKGVWKTTTDGKKYIYNDGTCAKGYIKIGSYYYYFNSSGIMQKYSQTINGKPYYFKSTGRGAGKGWITFKDGTKKYCLGNGKLATGYKKVGSYYYGFGAKTGKMLKYSQTISGKPYYFKSTGKGAGKGWITFKDGTKKYCLGSGKLATGYKKVGEYYYGFSSKTGKMLKYTQKISGKPYYFKSTGKGAGKGWLKFKSGNKKYCYGKGKLAAGYKKIGKYYYYFNSYGTMQKYSQTVNGKPYYFNGSGKAASKGWIKFKNGTKKYCLGNGKLATGTVKIGTTYYDFSSKGTYLGKTASRKYAIAGSSSVTVNQMVAYYKAMRGNKYPSAYSNTEAATIKKFCQIYYNECKAEGIKAEVAFCQAMKETGWLKFGGDVKISQYNFAGIGATGGGKPGHSFDTVTIGIRAHVQHLKAYANKEKLTKKCVDPRFDLVKRGTAPYVQWLGQKANPNGYGWAPAATYGTDIVKMIITLKTY